jgi:O-phosphoseryl-tRNA synthetase
MAMPNQENSSKPVPKKKLKVKKNNRTARSENIENTTDTTPSSKVNNKDSVNTNGSKRVVKNDHRTNGEPKKKVKLKVKQKDKERDKENGKGPYREALAEVLAKKKQVDERLLGASLKDGTADQIAADPKEIAQRDERIYYLTGKGKQHPVRDMQQNIRDVLIHSGFNELENQYFVPEKEVFEQYSLKSSIVLDETYYLGETQRIKFQLSPKQLSKFEESFLHIKFDKIKFNEIVNDYFDGSLNITYFFQRLREDMGFSNIDIKHLIEEIPELKGTNPRLTSTTLRSQMDSTWLSTIKAILDKDHLPLKVFSTGIWFKREPKQSELVLKSHYGASCIIVDDDITLDIGKIIVTELLDRLEIEELEFKDNSEVKEFKTNDKELEVYCNNIKIATCGLFQNKLLEKFEIDIPVLFINFGLEHLVMVREGMDDIRELMYPQFHSAWMLNDHEIAKAIEYIHKPKTEIGKEIAGNLYDICLKNNSVPSPCEFTVWEGSIKSNILSIEQDNDETSAKVPDEQLNTTEKHLIVKVLKKEKGNKLCGPAALNEIVVKNGDIYGVQNPEQNQDLAGATKTDIDYLNAFSNYVGREIEKRIEDGNLEDFTEIKAGIIKDMEDINLQLDGRAVRFISSNNKKIDVKGPMFVQVDLKFNDNKNLKVNEGPNEKAAKSNKSLEIQTREESG